MLTERPVDSARRFRMRCVSCKADNGLSAEDYVGIQAFLKRRQVLRSSL